MSHAHKNSAAAEPRRSTLRLFPACLCLAFATSCAAGAAPGEAPSPAPPTPEGEAAAEATQPPSDAEGRAAADSAAAGAGDAAAPPGPRTAPARWLHLTRLAESGPTAVPGAGVDAAYALLEGRSPAREVVVAVIDGGVDIQHEDLDGVLWVNEDEVAGNGIDDDGNGYADDLHGWSFLGSPGGESVDFDTFELTRLYAACAGGAAAAGLAPPGEERCAAIEEEYAEERAETEALVQQITQIEQVYPVILQILAQAVGGEPTPESVAALQSPNLRVMQARQAYLQLAAAGLDERALAEQARAIRGRAEFGLDPEYDPRGLVGDDWLDYDDRAYGTPDVEGPDPSHGTAVASVIAGERDNGVGVDGVATGVKIMAVRAVPNGDERDKDVANAIRYAVDNGADIINMSFGKAFSPGREAVAAAIRHADEHGVLMVHAAGNEGEDLAESDNFPTRVYPDGGQAALWIEVGASAWTTVDSVAAVFSNYGAEQVDIFAPGQAIPSAAPDDEYRPNDGTSLAAPVVSGVAALLMAYFPDLDAAAVRTILLETATDLRTQSVVRPGDAGGPVPFGDLSVTGGIVNAEAAVRRAME
ncbi:MAG TPA: S8 family peptidase [Longimicrobiales bacterium]|nr:S8 family peptidase [Longimicrobiales bacterium]